MSDHLLPDIHQFIRFGAKKEHRALLQHWTYWIVSPAPKELMLVSDIKDESSPAWTLLLPLRVPPYTDGWTWARRPGMTEHEGITVDDELTDDDDD